jgi:hypothetical protein
MTTEHAQFESDSPFVSCGPLIGHCGPRMASRTCACKQQILGDVGSAVEVFDRLHAPQLNLEFGGVAKLLSSGMVKQERTST